MIKIKNYKKKLLIICGPTAVGKTSLGVKLASKFNGEIVSADSRQVYRFMDIGTGKDVSNSKFKIQNEINSKLNIGTYEIETIPVWGLDLIKPDQEFSVAHWLEFAHQVIQDIWQRQKLPIIVGGAGFWIKSLIEGVDSMNIRPDWKMRNQLSNVAIKQLKIKLHKLNPIRFQEMNQSDKNNPRRLIRAIEIAEKLKSENSLRINNPSFRQKELAIGDLLTIGLKASNDFLYQRIDKRVKKRIQQGAQKEIESLVKMGYSWDLASMSATGYKEWQPFFQKKASLAEVIQRWQFNEHSYARRQITWFKKNKQIHWLNIKESNWLKKVVKLVENWYYKNNGKD